MKVGKKMTNYNEEGLRVILNAQLSDRLYTVASEYSVSIDQLTHLAIKRLLDDVDLLRNLRAGKAKIE